MVEQPGTESQVVRFVTHPDALVPAARWGGWLAILFSLYPGWYAVDRISRLGTEVLPEGAIGMAAACLLGGTGLVLWSRYRRAHPVCHATIDLTADRVTVVRPDREPATCRFSELGSLEVSRLSYRGSNTYQLFAEGVGRDHPLYVGIDPEAAEALKQRIEALRG